MRVLIALVLCALVAHVAGDCYMHGPRGSNDRLNEQAANRNNADRLFDSQNNNRGGYNVGDKGTNAADSAYTGTNAPDNLYSYSDADTNTKQYSMGYYEGSVMLIEWTNQHGCGGNEKDDPYNLNCRILLQYMCDHDVPAGDGNQALGVWLYDGLNTNTPTEPNSFADTDEADDVGDAEGHHESSGWYYECKQTDRNDGLFHADQNLNGDDARYTRQNPNGDRRGLECPEERDYYPYWRPTTWRDIAILTSDVQPTNQADADAFVDPSFPCARLIHESQNTFPKGKCLGFVNNDQQAPWSYEDCMASTQGTWMTFHHGATAAGITSPTCGAVAFSRANHLGNGRDNQPLTHNWTLPTLNGDLADTRKFGTYGASKCVLRIRYNISTDDYDPFYTDSAYDGDDFFPENPTVDIGANMIGLKLAINTNQFGRTFQDRSHVFYIVQRPAQIGASDAVYNLNVRGKRGNIVQTYPAVEYDFQPNRLHISAGDWIHLQWTGSNTHNNGNPGGDGQTGDAGEGTDGTDRSNLVQLDDISQNWPVPLDVTMYKDTNIFAAATQCYYLDGTTIGAGNPNKWVDCATTVATSGQYRDHVNDQYTNFNPTLDDAPASLIGGVTFAPAAGTYNYMCTRNNNFSNRSQKGTLIVA